MSEESSTQNGARMEVVPDYLKNFILTITKTFYGPECYVVADYIQRNVCVKEEKLRQFLKFDPKSLKPFLAALKVGSLIFYFLLSAFESNQFINRFEINYFSYLLCKME